MDVLLIVSHGIILSLCILYLIYVTAFGRALSFRRMLQSLVVPENENNVDVNVDVNVDNDINGNIGNETTTTTTTTNEIGNDNCSHVRNSRPKHEYSNDEVNENRTDKSNEKNYAKRLPRDSGTLNSFSYLISNPLIIAQGHRVQRLDVRNQLKHGVRHLHTDISLVSPNDVSANVDGRLRTLTCSNFTFVPFINVNNWSTNYNLLDVIDQLYDYSRELLDTVSIWIDRIVLSGRDRIVLSGRVECTKDNRAKCDRFLYESTVCAIRDYIRSLSSGDKFLIIRERNEKTRDVFAMFRRVMFKRDNTVASSFVTKEPRVRWYLRLE